MVLLAIEDQTAAKLKLDEEAAILNDIATSAIYLIHN